jgi:broad specificity phosphatase PhoE
MGEQAYRKFKDTPLMHEGVNDVAKLRQNWYDINKIELVVVSPLSRTLSTADLLFKNKNVPILALDELLEYPQSYQRCNMRDMIGNLVRIYPRINFDNIDSNIDFNFIDEKREEKEEIKYLENRILDFRKWVIKRPENNIAVVGHSSYFNYMINSMVDDETNELKHCHPYKITV